MTERQSKSQNGIERVVAGDRFTWGGRSFVASLLRMTMILGVQSSAAVSAEVPSYQSDIAPLLRQYCAGCHNDEDFEGDFSVERFADLKEGGSKGVMLKGGDPAGSYLIKLITGAVKEPMPPKDEPQLAAEEVAVFRNWIAAGAHGPKPEEDISILATLTVPSLPAAKGAMPITAIDRSPDGRLLAEARYSRVEILGGTAENRSLEKLPGKINAVHFSKDNARLVTASGITGLNGIATLWDLKSGQKIREFGEGYHRDVLYDAEFSPDGKLLATAGYDTKIAIWNVETGEEIRTIEVHNGAIFDLAFSPNGTVLASASADNTVKLWRVEDGERLDTLNQPQGEQFSVAFSPDGKFIFAGGADNRVRMWRLVSTDKPRINPILQARYAHEDAVVALAISADGKWLVSSSDDRSVKLWSLPDLIQVKAWEGQPDVASAILFSGNELVLGRMDGSRGVLAFDESTLLGLRSNPVESESVVAVAPAAGELAKVDAQEGAEAIPVTLPVEISGVVGAEGDADDFRFAAKAGEQWVLEVNAARMKSPLDSKVEVLTSDGKPIERVKLQAVRDSWFEFRGKNSLQVDDFRVFNWREMELNEYLYCNGEVVKLWLYPRGPDSGFSVYPGFGNRHNYFGTSGLAHALGEPCYVVKPLPAGAEPVPNGLPVYTILFENDDDPQRRLGNDSKLTFTAPADGEYLARISDVRGFGEEDFSYRLTIRPPKPDFKATLGGVDQKLLAINPGGGKEFIVKVERFDDFEGEIRIDIGGLPSGFTASTPIVVQAGQHEAVGVINAASDAVMPAPDLAKVSKLTATAEIGGKAVTREIGTFGELKVDEMPSKLFVEILPDGGSGSPNLAAGQPMELTIQPGETISAMVKVNRVDFKERIDFGREESIRNLAHGLIIDNIGLNGLMIPETQSEQRFFITAADWVPDSTRWVFLRTNAAGKVATQPIRLHVKRP